MNAHFIRAGARRRALVRAVALAGFVLLGAPARPASGYVRSRTERDVLMYWTRSCHRLEVIGQTPPAFTPESYLAAARRSAASWSAPQIACTSSRVDVDWTDAGDDEVENDGRNLLVYRAPIWCRRRTNPELPPDCSATGMLALTTVFSDGPTGRILDVDIEINGVDKSWGDAESGQDLVFDLENALTHELGHFLGLAHTCLGPGETARSPDDTGVPRPNCEAASSTMRESTLFPQSQLRDTTLRSLSADDERAMCALYPKRADDDPDASACTAVEGLEPGLAGGGGCAFGRGNRSDGTVPIAIGIATLAAVGRRRQNAARTSRDGRTIR